LIENGEGMVRVKMRCPSL